MKNYTTVIGALALSFASLAMAQDGTFPPGGGPGGGQQGGPGGPGGEGGQRRGGGDPAQLVERLMQGDTNKDGKLAKDEMPAQLADRIFERADTNKDGFLDKAELEAFAKSGGMRGPGGQGGQGGQGGEGRQGGRGGQPGGPVNLEGAMKQANGAYKALKASAFDAASRAADLEAVQRLQMALISSKGGVASAHLTEDSKKQFGTDKAAFETGFRKAMLKTAMLAMELETAILDGKSAEAKALVGKLHDAEEKGHDLFKEDEKEERGEQKAPANNKK